MKPKPTPFRDKLPAALRKFIDEATQFLLRPYRIFKLVCFWVGFVSLFVTFALAAYFHKVYRSLPDLNQTDYTQLRQVAQASLSRKQEDPNRLNHWTDIKDINRDFLYAIVTSEDATFFEHNGFDYDAIMNSLIEDLSKKKFESGASTISQQVVKNIFLSNEKAIIRKLKEVIITEKLEEHFKKNQILEVYLNIAEFGPDIFGVSEAANRFFGKSPADINAAEGAFIALMLPSPRKNFYAIYQNHYIAPQKRKKIRRILGDMMVNEFISPQQYKVYIKYDYFSHKRTRTIASQKKKIGSS